MVIDISQPSAKGGNLVAILGFILVIILIIWAVKRATVEQPKSPNIPPKKPPRSQQPDKEVRQTDNKKTSSTSERTTERSTVAMHEDEIILT